MKTKKLKHLGLNKKTVANLNNDAMTTIKAGANYSEFPICQSEYITVSCNGMCGDESGSGPLTTIENPCEPRNCFVAYITEGCS